MKLLLRLLSSVAICYLLSFNSVTLQSEFPFFNYNLKLPYSDLSFNRSAIPVSNFEPYDIWEERLRLIAESIGSMPVCRLMGATSEHFIALFEPCFSLHVVAISSAIGLVLWLFAVY